MVETLLQTKLHIPPLRPNLVPRLRLFQHLNWGVQTGQKLTLVSAPAGSGKTTLVSSWIQQLDSPAAWLSLDEGDNEPYRIVFYITTALQEAGLMVGRQIMALLKSPELPPLDTLLILLINDLAQLPDRVILVIDDYHVISDLEIHKAFSYIIENQPAQLHLVLISRSDPPFPLHRLRGSGQMNGIYFQDLRFTENEVASFFTKTMAMKLSSSHISTLEHRTEGWVTGLQLAALSMKDIPDPGVFIKDFAANDRYISDYLIAEVFRRQPVEIQDFLLRTAIFDWYCASLCDALLNCVDLESHAKEADRNLSSKAIIESLDHSNLFTIPLDNRREWYRYHHLFADFLRLRLRSLPADEVALWHRCAAIWFENNGFFTEAINHALIGKDFQRAGLLIEQHGMTTLWGHTQWTALIKWIEILPEEIVRSRLQLSMQYAWALFTTGRWQYVEPVLNGIETSINTTDRNETSRLLKGEVTTLRAWIAFEKDEMERCINLAQSGLELLPQEAQIVRSLAILAKGSAQLWRGQLAESKRNLEEAVNIGLSSGNLAVAIVALGGLVHREVRLGRFRKATELYQRARQLGSIEGKALLSPAGYACVQMGEVLRELGQLTEAVPLLKEGVQLCQKSGSPEMAITGQMILGRVLLAAGDPAGAAEQMALAESDLQAWLSQGSGQKNSTITPAFIHRGRYWLATRQVEKCADWLESEGFPVTDILPRKVDERYLLLARIFIANRNPEKARHLLLHILPLVESGEEMRMLIETLVLLSVAYQSCGEQNLANQSLLQALILAKPEGCMRIFLDDWTKLFEQLRSLKDHEVVGGSVRGMITAIHRAQSSDSTRIPENTGGEISESEGDTLSIQIEPLTERERSILQLIAAGLSNRQIAAELFLSVNTIKTYSSRIYSKLDVQNRAEAVDRAHLLGLL